MVITIDGPAGSGKSTVSKKLAQRLGFDYLDTGSIYRAITWKALRSQIETDNAEKLGRLARESDIRFQRSFEGQHIFLNEEDLTKEIRSAEVERNVSVVSAHPEVRAALMEVQRNAARGSDLVAEGRDMGTVVFPLAELKIFLTADDEVRKERRLREHGRSSEGSQRAALVAERDRLDSSRKTSPLKPADDAIVIDTSSMDIEEVVDAIAARYEELP